MKAVFVAGGTGGHVYPALAVAREYKRVNTDIYWIGRKNSLEEKIALEENFNFENIRTSGFRGKGLMDKLNSIFSLIFSIFHCLKFLKKIGPNFIFLSGGFISLSPGIASYILGIPIFIHEQNSIAGMANRFLSVVSTKTFEGFPSSFRKKIGVEYVGNPIREEISEFFEKNKESEEQKDSKFNLLILGGSTGSIQLNSIIIECLKNTQEAKNWIITHQTGASDKERVKNFYLKMSLNCKTKAFIENMGKAYREANLVVCRAGAMTISELIAMGKPSVLLPLPWATDNHQFLNATYLKDIGAAEVVISDEKNSAKLASLISELAADKERRLSMSGSTKIAFFPDVERKIFNTINDSIKTKP